MSEQDRADSKRLLAEIEQFRKQAEEQFAAAETARKNADSEGLFAINAKRVCEEHSTAIAGLKGTAEAEPFSPDDIDKPLDGPLFLKSQSYDTYTSDGWLRHPGQLENLSPGEKTVLDQFLTQRQAISAQIVLKRPSNEGLLSPGQPPAFQCQHPRPRHARARGQTRDRVWRAER